MGRKIVSGNGGKMARTFIDGSEYCNTSYEYTEVAEEEETTCSGSGGKNEFEYGNTHIEGSISADWDIGANPYLDPPTLRAGLAYRFLGYVHSAPGVGLESGPRLEIDEMKINNVKISLPAKGKVTVSFDFKSSGEYTLPVQASDSSSGL
jgi:hypothetical protein